MGLGFRLAFLSASVVLFGCSKTTKMISHPEAVNPREVKGVVIPVSANEADRCQIGVQKLGAHILYRNGLGVLFTDREIEKSKLDCRAFFSPNELISTEPPLATEMELPTLLRLIPAEEMGARSFVRDHPTYDGRGVTIAVLDTGIELDHPMLTKTSSGTDKVVDFKDFSGEGLVALTPVTVDNNTFKTADGTTYQAAIKGSDFAFGIFPGSTLQNNISLSKKDKFSDVGVLTYKDAAGLWRGRIDSAGNKDFNDDPELSDFKTSRQFTKLGEKKSLTVTLAINPEPRTASLSFDDGSHGTHVGGIAAGYQLNGLQGVAPGAQILCGKIGDNRLAGGSTTTASMMLAIDYAVENKAQIINLSYGVRAGSNFGKSTIEQYIDKVAREKGTIFSISAGNEGPGLLTIGTPAGADLAISNGAYLSKKMAQDLFNYGGVEKDGLWYFSSIGPRLDGGWKPTLLSPGTALSSVPQWDTIHSNKSGTSMASPETTGGIALLLSGALQAGILNDRATVTRAIYDSATLVPGLTYLEQGHGLFNIPLAFKALSKRTETPIEYSVSVNNAATPSGRGGGIYVRSRRAPINVFNVRITPEPTEAQKKRPLLRTMKLIGSADWIKIPDRKTLFIEAAPVSFQVKLDTAVFARPGLYSEKITAFDETTGEVVFEVPVTVVSPVVLTDLNDREFFTRDSIRVGQTLRYFFDVPVGATALQLNLSSEDETIWAQVLDAEGRRVLSLRDKLGTAPMPPLREAANIKTPGVYEIDVVAPPGNSKPTKLALRLKLFSLGATLNPPAELGKRDLTLTNSFNPLVVIPRIEFRTIEQKQLVPMTATPKTIPVILSESDIKDYSQIAVRVRTAKPWYDEMTDFPYRVFDPKKKFLSAGGLELDSVIPIVGLEKIGAGTVGVEIGGSFAKSAPTNWAVELTEIRQLKQPKILPDLAAVVLDTDQGKTIPLDLTAITKDRPQACPVMVLADGAGQKIQEIRLCD